MPGLRLDHFPGIRWDPGRSGRSPGPVSYTHLDYICAFKDGKIARFGTVEEVMTKENLSQIYQVDFEILTIAGKPLSIYY